MPTIPQLPPASTIGNADLFVLDQSGTTFSVTSSLVANFVKTSIALGTAAFVNVPIVPTNGGTGVSNPTIHTLPVAQGASNFNFVGPLNNGQLLIGSAGADPIPANITAGTNITVSNASGSITISASGVGGFSYTHVTGTTQTMASNTGYIVDNVGLVTLTLPATSSLGDVIEVVGRGAGGWTVVFNPGQYIILGATTATTTTGSISSVRQTDCFRMVCTLANTEWTVQNLIGALTVV